MARKAAWFELVLMRDLATLAQCDYTSASAWAKKRTSQHERNVIKVIYIKYIISKLYIYKKQEQYRNRWIHLQNMKTRFTINEQHLRCRVGSLHLSTSNNIRFKALKHLKRFMKRYRMSCSPLAAVSHKSKSTGVIAPTATQAVTELL